MTAAANERAFDAEWDLENYLVVHLSTLLSTLGQDLLVIGRQVETAFGRRIDLLAIDATGAIHIIEVKLGGTPAYTVGQLTDYLHWIQQLTREELIRVAAGRRRFVNLEVAFQEHFGHPLPDVINKTQVLTIIAASIDLRTQRGILAIRHPGLSTTMFRYVVHSDALRLIPCRQDGQDVEAAQAEPKPRVPRRASTDSVPCRLSGYRVHIGDSVRRFWQSHAQHFASHIVLFGFVRDQYVRWAEKVEGDPLENFNFGLFARQLLALIAESDEWTRVYLLPGNEVDAHGMLIGTPSYRTHIQDGHRIVAYLRDPAYAAPGL